MKDIIESLDLEDGFVIYHDDGGYWLAIRNEKGEIADDFQIDKETFNCIKKREASKK